VDWKALIKLGIVLLFRRTKMPGVPYPLSDYTGPKRRTCVDCIHSQKLREVRDQSKPVGTMHPLAYEYLCQHPDELFSAEMNQPGRFGNPFPCENWETSTSLNDEST
jgi:hypothetical protein